jgi:conjugative relaxase-like TrwC/TraI family protein
MIRFTEVESAAAAQSYYGKSDGGYYMDAAELRRLVGGIYARQLGLAGETPDLKQLQRLLLGRDPSDGSQLTARLAKDRVKGWDLTASIPKGVTEAIEGGDRRVEKLLWDTLSTTLGEIEERVSTRVRQGGRVEDRVTGNMIWYAFEHPETRPVELDGMPRPDRHIHAVIPSLTWDSAEQQCKAIKWRGIIDLRKWFSHRFDLRLSQGLADLGYPIETRYKPDGKGGQKYDTWDIADMPKSMTAWDSQRTTEINRLAGELKVTTALGKDKLGATSRLGKRTDLTRADCVGYWDASRRPGELEGRAESIRRAVEGLNPKAAPGVEAAVRYAIAHSFERNSVVDYTDLEVTAMERMMGRGRVEELLPEFRRQGVLLKHGEATTKAVLAQEQRILRQAREGKGSVRPLGLDVPLPDLSGLGRDQAAAIKHLWRTTSATVLIFGGAGTGKTTMMRDAIAGAGLPVVVLAPSSDASRGELREQGFREANTVAAFLEGGGAAAMQEKARGGIIWIDEASLLPIDDLERLCGLSRKLGARLVLQGDPRQHESVARHGNMLNVLHEYAGLPAVELKEIKRQKGDYAKAVAAIREGQWDKADRLLRKLGWVVEGEGHDALVEEYARAIKERKAVKADGKVQTVPKTVLVVDPTHKDGDALAERLRALRKAEGLIDQEDKTFARLVPLSWTDAEKGDVHRYGGNEVIQFFRSSGPFKAGQRVTAAELLPRLGQVKARHFQVYRQDQIKLAKGDTIRLTAGGATKDGHRVDNGRTDEIAGFTAAGVVVLSNGWVLDQGFGHWKSGLVSTSYAVQSRTHDVVLAAINRRRWRRWTGRRPTSCCRAAASAAWSSPTCRGRSCSTPCAKATGGSRPPN